MLILFLKFYLYCYQGCLQWNVVSENPLAPLQFTNHPCQRQALHAHYLGITIKRALLVEMSVSQTRSCEHGRTVPISHLSSGGMGGWSKDARRPLSLPAHSPPPADNI